MNDRLVGPDHSPGEGGEVASAPELCVIPQSVYDQVAEGLGQFFAPISRLSPGVIASDMLDARKAIRRHEILTEYTDTSGKKALELGSGYGTNLIVWTNRFGIDMTGVEPESEGFQATVDISRQLCVSNGVDPARIGTYRGESLPFPDAAFDIVYSANVLEHTLDPAAVLDEALRVLKPGGILDFEMPNFLSYFEGHYFVLMPPVLWRWVLPAWIRFGIRRDPHFATTMRTEINPIWLRKTLRSLGQKYRIRTISLGEDIFRDRLREAFRFETRGVESKISGLLKLLNALNFKDSVSRTLVLMQGHYPIYMTVAKD